MPDVRYAFFTCQESAVVMVGSAFERLFMQVRDVVGCGDRRKSFVVLGAGAGRLYGHPV